MPVQTQVMNPTDDPRTICEELAARRDQKEALLLVGQGHKRFTVLRPDIGRVHDREFSFCQPFRSNEMKQLECFGSDTLIVLVVSYEPTAVVTVEHLGRQEVLAGEVGFPRAGRANEDDEREFREVNLHHQPPRNARGCHPSHRIDIPRPANREPR